MIDRRATLLLAAALAVTTVACRREAGANAEAAAPGAPATISRPDSSTPASTSTSTSSSTSSSTTSVAPSSTSTSTSTSTTTTSTSTSTTTTSTTTTTTLPPGVFDPACVVMVGAGDSLQLIADRFDDETVDAATIVAENALVEPDQIEPGQLLDVCVDNGLDDITGAARTERNSELVRREVVAQQEKLNQLFAGYGIRELLVDGVSGPVTRQRLCAFRLAAGLPVSTADMAAGSEEEQILMATQALPIPFTSAILSERWILIDQTCQIMFVGEGTQAVRFVFPTSTGQPGYETRTQNRSRVFKYNPALENGGWHNSLTFPAAEDNPLNGNMYKPLYFDNGQAIHGANNVPTSPQSKGCARLRVEHHEILLAWLGLADATGVIHDRGRLNVTVNVQGSYVAR